MRIRDFVELDWPQVWPIVRAADTFGDERSGGACHLDRSTARTNRGGNRRRPHSRHPPRWGPNRLRPGSHIAIASFTVAAEPRGRSIGTALCRCALDWAKERDLAGMQLNAVAASNQASIDVYQKLCSASSEPCRAPSRTRRVGASGCTSFIARVEAYCVIDLRQASRAARAVSGKSENSPSTPSSKNC
jgi:GNAT superfamily N-acetyltransferase